MTTTTPTPTSTPTAAEVRDRLRAAVPRRKVRSAGDVSVSGWSGSDPGLRDHTQFFLNSFRFADLGELTDADVEEWAARARAERCHTLSFEVEVGGNPDRDEEPDFFDWEFAL